jgi:Na+-translocating ferredoxin:NAD+ oxidoreductase subunit D
MNLFYSKDRDERYKTVSLRPFKFLEPSVHTQSLAILIVLLPQIFMLLLSESFASLIVLASSFLASFAAEGIDCALHRKNHFSGLTPSVQGIIIGLLLPSTYPPVSVFAIIFITLLIAKYAYGGFANAWVNPVAITITVAWIIGMSKFPPFQVTFEQLQIHNPSLALIHDGVFPTLPFDTRITAFLNSYVFRMFGVSIPEGYISLFWDSQSLIPAFRFNFITLLSSIVLFATNSIGSIIPAMYLIVYSILVAFAGPLFYHGAPGQGDVLLALLSSGTLFCSIFVLEWYGTTPVTQWGKIIYGISAGIICFFITGCGTSPVGSVFTVLIANIFSPVIQYIEDRMSEKYLKKVLLPQVTILEDENA